MKKFVHIEKFCTLSFDSVCRSLGISGLKHNPYLKRKMALFPVFFFFLFFFLFFFFFFFELKLFKTLTVLCRFVRVHT